jgi:arylsulfatase A-like enzyme
MKLPFMLIAITTLLKVVALPADKPNVLVIVSDDQGYEDAGFQGGKQTITPHLDALAKSGVRCTSGYVTFPVCSPSRAGLLTGRHQSRFGHENNPVYDPLDPIEGLPLTERILPEFLKQAGYRTGWMGKWHLGSSPAHVPWKRGFDETYGFIGGGHRFTGWAPNGRQYTLPLTRNGEETKDVPPHLTTALGDEAAAFIRRNSSNPWMLYLAFNAPHTPHEPTPERLEKFAHIENLPRRRVLAQISLLDDAIGSITGALGDTGQTARTLVFYFSDNGGPVKSGAYNGQLRGGKGELYEGGIRVPFIVAWPDKIAGGKSFDHPVSSLDVFPSALAAAGVAMPSEKIYDGTNIVPHLAGKVPTPPHERLFWRMQRRQHFAVREGNWKLLIHGELAPELYDLAKDPGEMNNVAEANSEVVARISGALENWRKELIDPVFPGSSVKNEDWGPGGANQKNTPQKKGPAK